MPLFAILRVDADHLHPGSCILIEADSLIAIAQDMLENPERWKILLETLYPDETDIRSLWQRLQTDALTPQALLRLINQTQVCDDWIQMVRIQPMKIQSLEELKIENIWAPSLSSASNDAVN
ncbi:MAG: hypothetical protein KME42_08680 [Tildeniella nuda ZEHNDER 1965/U140]|jgi:hypothetical protein|nr:hypothetical protein [Tildeniella nuda ZEHNDER 1965/U140]